MRSFLSTLLLLVITACLTIANANAACYPTDPSKFTCVDFENQSSEPVTVTYDNGTYGCNTAAGTTCTFIVPIGQLTFVGRSSSGIERVVGSGNVPVGCCQPIQKLKWTETNKRSQIGGNWEGFYQYDDPQRQGAVSFTITIQQLSSTSISGTINDSEIGSANFMGSYDPNSGNISWVKTYTSGNHHPVNYNGSVSSNGENASGRWQVGSYGGSWSVHR